MSHGQNGVLPSLSGGLFPGGADGAGQDSVEESLANRTPSSQSGHRRECFVCVPACDNGPYRKFEYRAPKRRRSTPKQPLSLRSLFRVLTLSATDGGQDRQVRICRIGWCWVRTGIFSQSNRRLRQSSPLRVLYSSTSW